MRISLKRLYCFFFPLCFILNGYSAYIPGISLGTLVLLLFTFVSVLLMMREKNYFDTKPLMLVFFLVLESLLVLLIAGSANNRIDISGTVIGISKLFIWGVSICITNKILFDRKLLTKWMIRVSLFCTVYLFMQYIFFFFLSIYLPNIFDIPFIAPYNEDYLAYNSFINYSYFRPSSFFSEPAFYSNFILMTMVIIMFDKIIEIKNKQMLVFLFMFGIFLSTSTSGIFLSLPVFFLFIYKNYNFKRSLVIGFVGLSLMGLFLLYLNTRSDQEIGENKFLSTIKYTIEKPANMSDSRRVGDSYEYLNQLDSNKKIFGIGIGNEKAFLEGNQIYLNSITTLIVDSGYFGLILFVIFILYEFLSTKHIGAKYIELCYFIKCFSSGFAFGIYGILYLSIAFYLKYGGD